MEYLNKKGQVFVSFLFIMTLVVFIFAFVQMENKYTFWTKEGIEKKLGDLQFKLIDKYAQGEDYLFYLDQSVKYSLDLALYNLAENGGHYVELGDNGIFTTSECGDYNGYQVWATPEKDCYPNYGENFEIYFDAFFSEYMKQFDIEDPYFDVEIVYDEKGMLNLMGLKNEKIIQVYREGQQQPQEKKQKTKEEISTEGIIWPLDSSHAVVSSCYGNRILNGAADCHDGIDIPAPTGTPVYAIADGVVIDARSASSSSYGNSVAIEHNGFYSTYSHLSAAYVRRGDKVKKGQNIGLVGNTGKSYGSHLDLKLYSRRGLVYGRDTADINPLCVLANYRISSSASGECACGAKCT